MKKTMIGFAFFACAMTSITAHALTMIPPYYFTAQEITAILQSDEVAEKITSGRMIDAVVRDGRSYLVHAQDCSLKVDVEYQLIDPTMNEPLTIDSPFPTRHMVLKVGELLCLPEADAAAVK